MNRMTNLIHVILDFSKLEYWVFGSHAVSCLEMDRLNHLRRENEREKLGQTQIN